MATSAAVDPPVASPGRGRRWARRLFRTLLGLLVLVVVFLFGIAPYWLVGRFMSGGYVFPDRENAGLSPASFDLPFEDVTFSTSDGLTLSGWWVPAANNAVGDVVLVHGVNRSRIENVRKVPFLHARGFNVLLFDMRHHGKSGGALSTFGYLEQRDVRAAVAYAHSRSPGPVVAWGISLGAASVVLDAADDPAIAGIVCDSSYRSLVDTVRHHAALLHGWAPWLRPVPVSVLAEEALFWIGRRGGFDPRQVDVVQAAHRLGSRPALFVCNSGDRRMPMEIAFELKDAAGPQARVLVVPGHSHGGSYREATAEYQHAVSILLDEVAVKAQGTAGG
jgi:pimeloyl-ACP methyl ester carboxylesterase